MRTSTRVAVSLLTMSGLVAGTAVAHAQTPADTGDTNVTFTVVGFDGDLEISVVAPLASLGLEGTNREYAQGTLGTVSIRDRRAGNGRQWTASVQSTDFVHQSDPALKLPASGVSYRATAVAGEHGSVTNHMSDWTPVDSTSPVVSVSGINLIDWTWTWIPNLRVAFPSGSELGTPAVAAGQYAGTVTTSVI